MAGSRARRWGIAVVVVVAVALIVLGAMGIVLGLVGRMSTETGGLVPDGRLLRHVALADGRSLAEVLIAGGYGREYPYDRPYAGRAAHRAAQAAAREAGLGIWGPACTAGSG